MIHSFNATITWQEVSCAERNGQVTGYRILITQSNSEPDYDTDRLDRTLANQLIYVALNLTPLTMYNVRIRPIVAGFEGPYADKTFTTISDGK